MTDKFGRAVNTGQVESQATGVTKSYVRANYIESNMEEDIDMKQKFKIKNLVDPTNDFDAANKSCTDKSTNESTLLRIPTYEPLTNDYVSLKNVESNKVIELATTNYVKDDISIKNYNKTNDIIDSIDVANHDFTPTIITLPTKQYIDSKLKETNNRARRSINEHPDIMRKDLEHTFASGFVYNNFYEIHRTGRFNASSEVSPDDILLGIPYTIFTVTGPNARVAQIHVSALNVNVGSRYTLRFLIRSQSLKNITFGFAAQSSTEHTLTYDFELIESTATHTNTNEFNVFIDLSSLAINETVEIAALYIEVLNTSDQINENIDLKFQHKVINSAAPTNDHDLVTKNYVDNDNTIVRNNKEINMNGNKITNIGNPDNSNDVVNKAYIDNDTTIVRNNKDNNFNNNIISNIGNPVNSNDAVTKNYVDNDNTIVRNNQVNNFNNNRIINIGYPQNDKDAVCKSYIDDNGKAAISTHPYVLKYQLENIFASPHICDKYYELKYNEFPFNVGNSTKSYTANDLWFLGEKYERYNCTGNNSYTMDIPISNLPELIQNKTYKMTFIMRGVNNSIGKTVGLGIWKEGGMQSDKNSILKESWSFAESEEVVNNTTQFNFFFRLRGESANLAVDDEVDVAALYIKEIGTINNFNDTRITNVKDPVDDSDVATKQYVDNRKRVIEIKSKTIMLSNGRTLCAGLSGSFSTTMTQNIIINGSSVTSFTKPSNEDRSITIFQNPIELTNGDVYTFHSSNTVDVFAIWVEIDLGFING